MPRRKQTELMVNLLIENGYGTQDLKKLGEYLTSEAFKKRVGKPADKLEKQIANAFTKMKIIDTQAMYLKDAIKLMLENGNELGVSVVYAKLAERFDVNSATIERYIKIEIEQVWKTADKKVLAEYLGKEVASQTQRPKNCVFIQGISNKLLMESLH